MEDSKTCTKCNETKTLDYFYLYRGKHTSQCKSCRSKTVMESRRRNPEKYNETRRKWRKTSNKDRTDPHRNKVNHYLYKYGITLEELERLHIEHDNKCAICGSGTQKLYVDHCHDTGKIRGLLCQKCNSAIGFLKDDPQLVENALNYLRKSEVI